MNATALATSNDCEPRGHLVRFLLRVSPELGVEQVRASLADRTTRCYTFLFQNLDDELPQAEKIAIESLNDPDAQVVSSAVRALGRWGDAEAEAPLWSRLERFYEEWKSRAAEVVFNIGGNTPGQHAFQLEQELEVALLSGRGWLCPPEKLARLSDLALSDFNRDQIKLDIEKWRSQPFDIDTVWVPGKEPAFYVLSYADLTEEQLRAKLAQFPRGLDALSQPPAARRLNAGGSLSPHPRVCRIPQSRVNRKAELISLPSDSVDPRTWPIRTSSRVPGESPATRK